MVSLGELVKAQMPVMTVVRVDPLKLHAEIPERMAPWVKVGQPRGAASRRFSDRASRRPSRGSVQRSTTQTRAFRSKRWCRTPKALLKPGTFARVQLDDRTSNRC